MLFNINQQILVNALQQIVGVIDRKQTHAILSNILLVAHENTLTFTGTDLEIQLVAQVHSIIEKKGNTTVSARKLLDICRLLPEDSIIKIELKKSQLHINAFRSSFRLSTLNPAEYPEFSSIKFKHQISLESLKFKNILKKTSFCMANQDVRYFLNGMMLHLSGTSLIAVASDGHRLAMYKEKLTTPFPEDIQMIIPRKGVMELIRIIDESFDKMNNINISKNIIQVTSGQTIFSSKLIDGKFPDFNNILKQNIDRKITLKSQEIKASLSRVSVLSNESFRSITLVFSENIIKITTNNNEHEEAHEEIDILYQGDNFEVAFNAGYIVDAINNIDSENVNFSFTEKTNICIIEDENDKQFKFVIMPLRL